MKSGNIRMILAGIVVAGAVSLGGRMVAHASDSGLSEVKASALDVLSNKKVASYDAWEAFLKQRNGSAVAVSQVSGIAMDSPRVVQAGTIQRGGLPEGSLGSLLATIFGGVGLAGIYLVRKKVPTLNEWLTARATNRKGKSRVKVLSIKPISQQGSVAVVEVFDEVLVLGVTSGRVSLLARMNADGEVAAKVDPQGEAVPCEPRPKVPQPPAAGLAPELRSRRVAASPRAQTAEDFTALLSNLVKGREYASPVEGNSPLARYAAMSNLHRDGGYEPPPEDMAGQVLRKMKTMKRFRNSA